MKHIAIIMLIAVLSACSKPAPCELPPKNKAVITTDTSFCDTCFLAF